MDDRRFDSWTRSLVHASSRRGILAGAIAGVASRFLPPVPGLAPQPVSATGGCSKIICDVKCPDTLWFCIARACACGSTPREADEAGTAIIKSNGDGEIVAAAAYIGPDRGYIELTVARDCVQQPCTSTMVAEADGAPVLTMEATASVAENDSRPRLRQGIAIKAAGVSVSIAVETGETASTITSVVDGQPPIAGVFNPATGQIFGDWICSEVPFPFASELTSLEPALLAIAGGSMVGSASKYCPPGSPGPTIPFPPDPAPAILTCDEQCNAAGIASAIVCCALTGPGCLGCLAAAGEATGICHLGCAALKFAGGEAQIPGIDDTTGPATPTPRANSGATDSGADASGTPDTDSELVGSDSSRECTAGERRCGDRCIPLAECPDECCLDPGSCGCVCPDCLPPFVPDPASCACVCGMTECPANYVFDASLCGCVCGMQCPPNYVFDEANCACLCTTECPPTFVFDEATCSCVCELMECPPNLTFTPESCACYCEPPPCPPGFFVDQASCTCFCPDVACGEGQVFDPGVCACVGSGVGSAVDPPTD